MKRTFDNFQAVDSGFASFVGLNPTTAFDNLVAQLPQQYQDALNIDNLSSKLNSIQLKELYDNLEYIANNNNTPLYLKLRLAKMRIDSYEAIRVPMEQLSLQQETAFSLQDFVSELQMLGDIDEATIGKISMLPLEQQMQLQQQLMQVVLDTQITKEQKRSLGKEIITNFVNPQNSQTKSAQSQNQNESNDAIKNVFILLAVGIVGYIGYVSIKK